MTSEEALSYYRTRLEKAYKRLTICENKPNTPADEIAGLKRKVEALNVAIMAIMTADQLAFERNIALSQLRRINKGFAENMDDVVSAYNKSKPKKPIIKNDRYGNSCYYCGSCKNQWLAYEDYNEGEKELFDKFCTSCGQKIDWSEE